jgi:hypothetical protein
MASFVRMAVFSQLRCETQRPMQGLRTVQVYRARHRHTSELFAIKRSRHRFASRAHRERCLHEVCYPVRLLPRHLPNISSWLYGSLTRNTYTSSLATSGLQRRYASSQPHS